MDSKHSACWSGTVDDYALLAELTKAEQDGNVLKVHVQRNGRAWTGSIKSSPVGALCSKPNGCARTRGTELPERAFKLLSAGKCDGARTRVVDNTSKMAIMVETAWGVELGVHGVYLPVARVTLHEASGDEFLSQLFGRIANTRAHEADTLRRIAKADVAVDDLRAADDALALAAPALRRRKTVALTDALNRVKARAAAGP